MAVAFSAIPLLVLLILPRANGATGRTAAVELTGCHAGFGVNITGYGCYSHTLGRSDLAATIHHQDAVVLVIL